MSYKLEVRRKTEKTIEDLPPEIRQRVWEHIEALKENPRPHSCLKLTEFKPDGWRIRVGKYRILYRIDDKAQRVSIFHADLRDDAYNK
jgi:mRNA interferase RelE/StbE